MFQVAICGNGSHHAKPFDWQISRGFPDYLLLFIKTAAWIFIDNKRTEVQPNVVVLFDKNSFIRYGCEIPGYNDDWIHFNHTKSEDAALLSSLHIPINQPFYPMNFPMLSSYVWILTKIFHSTSAHSAQNIDALMRALLYTLSDESHELQPQNSLRNQFSTFSKLRSQIYNNPAQKWSVNTVAESLHFSCSYFEHLYKQLFGTTCQKDIIFARLEQAKFYLNNTNISIRDTAEFCGYESESHFLRQFKKFTGITPSEFRKMNIQNNI